VMHGADIAVSDRGYRHVANDCLFDTKRLRVNRHENFPDLHSSSFTQS